MTAPKGTPYGYEGSVVAGPGGWAVWAERASGLPPCPGRDCTAPYDENDPAHALECPTCEEVGCEHCIMLFGRGCQCVDCEEG